MSESLFDNPTQFENTEIKIDGQDVRSIFLSVSIFEDIYKPCITGNIVLVDSDGAGFIEEQGLEFIEPISLKFKNSLGEAFEFEGLCNGLRNESVTGTTKMYAIDFSSEMVRKNEQTFITKSFKNTSPEEIVREMCEKLGGELKSKARGKKMNYLGSRRKPRDIIEYVCTHGLTQETQATENSNSKQEQAKGTTGFLCWETADGFKFESVKDVLDGKSGEEHTEFKTRLANRGGDMETVMKSIIDFKFSQIGDFQTKLRSGAFASKNISFDFDKGLYKEYNYYNEDNMTPKQKEYLPAGQFTRFFMRPISNQKFNNECKPTQPLTGDQSRAYLQQNSGGQNTFTDQTGSFTLYPQFNFRAGDVIDVSIAKVKDQEKAQGGYDKKHSGKYVMQAVAHHFFNDGKAYTAIKTIRSTTEQNEVTATKS